MDDPPIGGKRSPQVLAWGSGSGTLQPGDGSFAVLDDKPPIQYGVVYQWQRGFFA